MCRRLASVLLVASVLVGCSGGGGGRITLATAPTTTGAVASTTDPIAPGGAAGASPVPGAADVGDPVTPGAGNGGYDVQTYDLRFDLADDRSSFDGVTTIDAVATSGLASFNLDLSGFDISSVTVDDRPADIDRAADEVTVTPSAPIEAGASFTTVVTYSGSPSPVPDPSAPGTIGWLRANSGTYVASEPVGAKGFFPSNDHPSDKARFTITVEAAASDTVVANGIAALATPAGEGRTSHTFTQTVPMATYLVQIAVGDYDVIESTGPHGLPLRHAVARHVPPTDRAVLDQTAGQIEYFESLFGTFPLDTYGILVADAAPDFALETQTLTLLPAQWLAEGGDSASSVLAHELAHQWFGDAVTPSRWSDIWLNEGFATYAEWLWSDHTGAASLASQVDDAVRSSPGWRDGFGPITQPTPAGLFSPNQYGGAALVLHALRLTIGDDAFFATLRAWVTDHDGGSATTADFEALAAATSGRDLGSFFDAWLRSTTVPELPA